MRIAIIGGGPAGLRAAEVSATGGASVTVFDAKRSVGRKFLVAGRGGLNLTHEEPLGAFAARYSGANQPPGFWASMLAEFGPADLRAWAAVLDIETFVASTGRVYPIQMKAAPLLRRWRQRLGEAGVGFSIQSRWTGLTTGAPLRLHFESAGLARDTVFTAEADAAIFALGGASWPETGSDGGWRDAMESLGVSIAPWQPSNCGWELDWPPGTLAKAEGRPLKNISASAGGESVAGELMVASYGLEGGVIYRLGPELRAMAEPRILVDFKPGMSVERLMTKLGQPGRNWFDEACRRWRLGDAATAILQHHPRRATWNSPRVLAEAVKACPLLLRRPRPIAEAISSAGGVEWSELNSDLMIRRLPGVFAAGEMIDWDAPTGGYLIQGCFSTGTRAARGALRRLRGGT